VNKVGAEQLTPTGEQTMTTQQSSGAPTSWWDRIREAEERGEFTEDEKDLSAEWVTCACGEQDGRLLQDNGIPRFTDLMSLGVEFCGAVDGNRFADAKYTLARIENRAAYYLSKMAFATGLNAVSDQSLATNKNESEGGDR
jgi:hypothetical protein